MGTDLLIWVERAGHVEAARACAARRGGTVIALAPAVMQALDGARTAYRIPEDFVDGKALNEVGLANYVHLEALGQWVGGWLQALRAGAAVNPVFAHYYRLKLLVDSVGLRVAEVAAVLQALRPARVLVLHDPRDPLWARPDSFEFITTDGPVYAAVVPYVAECLGIAIERLALPAGRTIGGGLAAARQSLQSCRAALHDARALLGLARHRLVGRRMAWSLRDDVHDLPHLLRASREAGGPRFADVSFRWRRTGRWIGALLGGDARGWTRVEERLAAGWPELREYLATHPLFTVEGIPFLGLVEPALRHLFSRGIVEAERSYRAAQRLARAARVRLLLGVHTGSFRDAALTQALRDDGVPVIFVQEGGFYGYLESPMHHHVELSMSDHFFAYGPGVTEYLAATRRTPRQAAAPLAVGALGLRALRRRHASGPRPPREIRRLMYVPTGDFHHALRYAPLLYSAREYYRIKRRILEALAGLPGAEVIYKLAPGSAAQDDCRAFVAAHRDSIELLDAPLGAVLDRAEVFLLDWPSTTLLEVLATAKPVAVLVDPVVCRPIPRAIELLRRRALVLHDLPAFLEAIRGLALDSERTLAGLNFEDTAFLEAYGTGGTAGWSPAAVADFFSRVGSR